MQPLQTDEKLENSAPKERDFDGQMLFGCSGFVGLSFATYFLSIWPFLVWMQVEFISVVIRCLLLGQLPALALGLIGARKFELPGAAGFIGGCLASNIFLYLRFQQAFLEAEARRTPWPDYPQIFQTLIPVGSVVLAVGASVLVLLRSKLPA
jgi:hypothetical protein